LFVAFALPVFAALAEEKPETPATLAGGKVISVEEAKKLLDGKGAAFFDTRAAVNFGKGHIPGATAVSYKERSAFKADFDISQDQFDPAKLPADKGAKIVFYSDGPTGWKSYKAAVLAIKDGRKHVMWMRSGFDEWRAKGLPVE
jgi:rhodanese-related sulfurtransferase